MRLSSPKEEIHVDGVSAARKFVDQDRVVVTITSLFAPLGSGLLFREKIWMVILDPSASGSFPSPTATLFQSSYRLYLEKRDPACAISPESAYIHSFIMRAQGERMRIQLMQMQNIVRHELDLVPVSSTSGPCLQLECGAAVTSQEPQAV